MVCLKNFFYYPNKGQSAGNLLSINKSSSETTREAFIFKDSSFMLWSIEFAEEDGIFIINKSEYKIVK